MSALELRIPPLVLVLAAALAMWLITRWMPGWRFDVRGQSIAAMVLANLGVLICVAGVYEF